MMARFKFCLVGSPQAPVLELPVEDLTHLHARLAAAKFVEGRMVAIDDNATNCDVLIPTSRILMILAEPEASGA